MLSFFPIPYKDELLYSVFARYHRWSGHSNWELTSKSIFGRLAYSSADLPSNMQAFCENLTCTELTSDKFIAENTLFPLYRPFFPQVRAKKILNLMKECGAGSQLMRVAGILKFSIKQPRFLKHCPACINEEEKIYGEAYWHRSHQVAGVYMCHKHSVWLQKSNVAVLEQEDRRAYHCLEIDRLCSDLTLEVENRFSERYFEIARDIHWVLNNELPVIGIEAIHSRYLYLLKKMGFTTFASLVRRSQLVREIAAFYGKEFLFDMQSKIDPIRKDNWATDFLRQPRTTLHPLRHLLFMRFLGTNPKEFWKFEMKSDRPFGDGPWPCLNPASRHYREAIVTKCDLTRSNETKGPVGIFTCDCGYTYSRIGPDTSKDDKYRADRVVSYGHVWEKTILRLAEKEKKSFREIGRRLNICHHTVREHLSKIKTPDHQLNPRQKEYDERRQSCRDHLKKICSDHPTLTRSQIRLLAIADYAWLYRNDRDWLFKHMPTQMPAIKNLKSGIDWIKRDNDLSGKISQAAEKIKHLPGKPVRVTNERIARMLGMKKFASWSLNKLPKTKKALNAEAEPIEAFHVRKIRFASDEILNSGLALTKWNILGRAGLRGRVSERIAREMDTLIQKLAAH